MGSVCTCYKKSRQIQARNSTTTPVLFLHDSIEEERLKLKIWDKVFQDYSYFNDPISHFHKQNRKKFNKLLIDGPPSAIRWEVWKAALSFELNVPENMNINPEFLSLIEKDVERTFPFHPFFNEPQNISSLKNVLIGVASLNPELGYCQGMNYVAGILLLVSDKNVNETVSMMDSLINHLSASGLFEPGFPKILDLLEKFKKIFIEKAPALYQHFLDIELDDNLWLTK